MSIIIQLEFETAYFEAAVKPFSHYTMGTPLYNKFLSVYLYIKQSDIKLYIYIYIYILDDLCTCCIPFVAMINDDIDTSI